MRLSLFECPVRRDGNGRNHSASKSAESSAWLPEVFPNPNFPLDAPIYRVACYIRTCDGRVAKSYEWSLSPPFPS